MQLSDTDRRLVRGVLQGESLDRLAAATGLSPDAVYWRLRVVVRAAVRDAPVRAPQLGPETAAAPARLSSLLDLWNARRGTRLLPRHGNFRFTDLQPWIDNVGIVEVAGAPAHVKVRLAGRKIVEYDGADFSGRYLEDAVPEALRADFLDPYGNCIAERAPQYSVLVPPDPSLADYRIHRVLLPCSADGSEVDIILVGIFVEAWDRVAALKVGNVYQLLDRTGS